MTAAPLQAGNLAARYRGKHLAMRSSVAASLEYRREMSGSRSVTITNAVDLLAQARSAREMEHS
jgi:hypothetical protein